MIDLTPVRFSGYDSKVVRAVQRHPRLTALLPASIEPLVTAYVTAKATADEVAKLKTETPNFGALLDADLKAGRQPDAAKLVEQYAAAQREAEEIRAVVQQLGMLPARYQAEVIREVQDVAATMYDDLADQLDDVLDRGTALLAKLGDVSSAEEALDADKGKEWKAAKALAAEYADIREASLALARAEDSLNYSPGSLQVALLFFGGDLEVALPAFVNRAINGDKGTLVGFRRDPLPYDPTNHQDLGHFLGVLRGKNLLQPHVGRPSEVSARLGALHEATRPDGVQREPGRLAQEYGGEEAAVRDSYIAQRVRTQGPGSGGFVLEGSPPRSRR